MKCFSLLSIAVTKDAFRYFDKDGDGQITIKDLVLGCNEVGKIGFMNFCFNALISLKQISLHFQGERFDEATARDIIEEFDDNGKLIQIIKANV